MFRLRFSSFGVLKEIFNLLILSARKMWKSRNLSDRVMKELRVLRNNISSAVEKLNIGNVRYIRMKKIIRTSTVATSLETFCKDMLRELNKSYEVVAVSSDDDDLRTIAKHI